VKGPATQQERIAKARPQAINALGDIAAGRPIDEHDDDLVRVALLGYRLRYRSCPASASWLFYDGNPKTARIRGTPERVDVYCLFCRVLLVNGAVWQHDYTEQLRPHTTICALRSLAGLLEPGAPHTYLLPSEAP
jgi:hypothetical protein